MSARYSQSSGFNPRDRSPQRFGDRRPPIGPRGSEDAGLPMGREPPRGPKALIDHPPRGAPFGGRGRGYAGRGDFRDRDRDPRDRDRERDRDFRDSRDGPPPFRRDLDRDWGRRGHDFDVREPRVGFGRGRSRSPPPPRDFRDIREPIGRDPDVVRMRRGSRDSLISVSSGGPDGPPVGHHPRPGPMRGRGRGDWEGGRGRGRPFLDDRDSFRRRSRSRGDTRWDRDRDRDRDRERLIDRDRERERVTVDRDRDRDIDRRDRERDLDRRDRFDRRDELDRRMDREDRERPVELFKRDRPSSRNDTRNPSISSIPAVAPQIPTGPPLADRITDPSSAEPPRKPSVAEPWRDGERPEPLLARTEPVKELMPPVVKRSTPPAAPQVPAFGSVTAPIPELGNEKSTASDSATGPPLPKVEKERRESQPKPQTLPPTGPKADRGPPSPALDQRPRRDEQKEDEGVDAPPKPESPVRSFKPQTLPVGLQKPAELSPPTAPAAMVAREGAKTPDSSPSKAGSGILFADSTRGPPSAGRSTSPGSHTSPRMPPSSIPTGPRALQQRLPQSRGPSKANKQWVRPGYNRPPPQTSPTILPKRNSIDIKDRSLPMTEDIKRDMRMSIDEQVPSHVADKSAAGNDGVALEDKETLPAPEPSKEVSAEPQDHAASPHNPLTERESKASPENKSMDVIPDFGASSDEEEDENVFTQEYLEERKQIFEKDMKALRAEMPPPPLEDPNIVSLLMRIQLLGMIANETEHPQAQEAPPPTDDIAPVEKVPPTFHAVETEKKVEDPEPPTKLVLNSIPDTVSVESLPFLQDGPPTPLSDMDICQENNATHERIKSILRDELIDHRKAVTKKNAELRFTWLAYYKQWRMGVWEMDRAKEKEKSVTPGATPPPAPPPPVIPLPVLDSRESRRYKGNSELDFQNALRASEISAQEELARRRENKATAQPDLNREAVIPDMLEPRDVKALLFKDTNNIVDPSQAKDVFGFIPPPNDFTPEEHEKFTDAFMAYPKKWGKIAEALPGRDFKQCIVHYYLTKEEIKYKAKLNKRWSRRGRARRSARPKSNALMADLGVVKPDYDGEEEPTPVTDTGRPRRAAAPTFGDTSADAEPATNGRRGNVGKDGEQPEKPASRRGGRTGTGTRGGRRAKAAQQQQQLQQQQQAFLTPQPEQPNLTAPTMTLASAPVSTIPHMPHPEAPEMSIETPSANHGVVRFSDQLDVDRPDVVPRTKPGRGRPREPVYPYEPVELESQPNVPVAGAARPDPQPTSYWSVPEQRDFPVYLAHFGRDFEAISAHMKTKSTQMVKNYFQRQTDAGNSEFQDIITSAEARKSRGEPVADLPVQSFPTKRRYESMPSAVNLSRPLAPHTEAMPEYDTAAARHAGQPISLHTRPFHEREPSMSRYPMLAQASSASMAPHSPAMALAEESSRALHPQPGLPSRMSGPRLGYFADDRRDVSGVLSQATPRPHEHTLSSRVAGSAPDMARMETLASQGYRGVDLHGSPLLSNQGATASTHQPYLQSLGQPHTQAPPLMSHGAHSRQTSLTKLPSSPVQILGRHEPDMSHMRRDSTGQRSFYPLAAPHTGLSQQPPILSPSREPPRPTLRPVEPEPPRQVPAKRSNIMSILNDEPEEPQPRKRFASDQASITPVAGSPSRPVYTGSSSLAQPAPRQEESVLSASQSKVSGYPQINSYLPASRPFSEYSSYNPGSGPSGPAGNTDWLGRFDPRGQQQSHQPHSAPPPPSSRPSTTLASQPPYSPYASSQTPSSQMLPNLNAPSPAPTPPPAQMSQRPSYPASVYAPSPAPGTGGSRDLPSQGSMYRSTLSSPTPRNSHISYPSRPGLSSTSSYGSTAPTVPVSGHMPGTPQPHPSGSAGYQHVQPLVAHQPQPHRPHLGLAGAHYGRNTPPPQPSASRMAPLPGPSSQQMGRSYTPPTVLQPNPAGGLPTAYAPSGPGNTHHLQTRHPGPGSLNESVPGQGPGPHGSSAHHRVYSQGSNPFPGPLPSQHPSR